MKVRLLHLLFLCLLPWVGYAQENAIKGTVVDAKTKEPLSGVSILVKNTTRGVIAGAAGDYVIQAAPTDTLLFSFIGYLKKEVLVGNQTTIDVSLSEDVETLDEIVVMGYTTQKKKDLTGSVAVVNVEDLGVPPYANVLQSLQGRVAGVTISQDGQPGSGRTNVRIRGMTTLNNNSPLYVVDGIATTEPLDNLNPNDIESIQVLKDAAAASIYGSRSAAGVIVITTKKGRGDSFNVDAGVVKGVQTLPRRVEVLNAQEWGEMYWRAAANSRRTPNIALYGGRVESPQVVTTPFPVAGTNQTYQFTPEGTNWADEVYRPASNNQYFVNLTAGSQKGSYGLGFSYFDQDGVIKHTYYKRLTTRINSIYNIRPWLRIGENASISWSNQVQTGTQDTGGGIPYQVIRQHPALPVFDTDGRYAGGNVMVAGLAFPNSTNPVATLYRNKDNNSNSWRIFGNAFIEADMLKAIPVLSKRHGLLFKSNIGIDYSNFFARHFTPTFKEGGFINETARYSNNYGDGLTRTWINTAEYSYTSSQHRFKALLGHEVVAYQFRNLSAANSGYTIEDPNYVQISSGLNPVGGGGAEDWALLSYFGRIDYAFKDRYLASATLRQDKTSRLKTYGVFPAFSLGWNVDQEKFAERLFTTKWINSFKLIGSWGQMGNQNVPTYAIYSTFGPNRDRADYDLNGDNSTVSPGYIVYQRGNLDLRWETTTQANVGFVTHLLNRNLELNVDYFIKRTDDILRAPATIAAEGEGGRPFRNTASVENKGVDLNLTYFHGSTNDRFNFTSQLQFSAYRNKVLSLGQGVGAIGIYGEQYENYDGETRAATGYAFPSFYGWVADGLFQNDTEVQAHAEQPGKAPGRIRYRDLNNDGVINDLDRTYLGSPNPDFTLGLNSDFNYRNFNFSFFIYGSKGNKVYNYTRQNTDFFEPNFNVGRRILDAWSPENTSSTIPAPQLTATNNERRPSSYFVEDASFVRLRSIRLGYKLPYSGARINIYGEVQNAYTLTRYSGIDPEVPFAGDANVWGIDRGFYPLPRTFMLGITLGLK